MADDLSIEHNVNKLQKLIINIQKRLFTNSKKIQSRKFMYL